MLDIASLLTAINAKVAATGSLSTVNGKVAYGEFAEGVTRPKVRVSTVQDALDSAFGNSLFPRISLQFSIFADDLGTSSSLQKAINTAFHAASLTLCTGQTVKCKLVNGAGLLVEKQTPTVFVYHCYSVIEFVVTN